MFSLRPGARNNRTRSKRDPVYTIITANSHRVKVKNVFGVCRSSLVLDIFRLFFDLYTERKQFFPLIFAAAQFEN